MSLALWIAGGALLVLVGRVPALADGLAWVSGSAVGPLLALAGVAWWAIRSRRRGRA